MHKIAAIFFNVTRIHTLASYQVQSGSEHGRPQSSRIMLGEVPPDRQPEYYCWIVGRNKWTRIEVLWTRLSPKDRIGARPQVPVLALTAISVYVCDQLNMVSIDFEA